MVARTLEELLTELRGKVTRLERRLNRVGAGGGGGGGGGTTFTVGPGLDLSGTNVLSVEPQLAPDLVTLPPGTNLNNVLATGWSVQRLSAEATVALNYPINRAGHLQVQGGLQGTGADLWLQTYTEYAPVAPATLSRQWRRTNYNGTWTPWTLVSGPTAALPAPIRYTNGGTATISATTWAAIPGMTPQTMTVDKPCWVLVTFGAWVISGAGETRFGVALSGATVLNNPNDMQGGNTGSGMWGQTGYMHSSDMGATGSSAQRSIQRLFRLEAGTTTFTPEAYMATAGAHATNYATLEVTPLYYEEAVPGASALPVNGVLTKRATTSGQTFATTDTTVTWNVQEDDSGHFTYNANGTFTCVVPGTYRISTNVVSVQVAATGWMRARIVVNGATAMEGNNDRGTIGARAVFAQTTVNLNAGDTVLVNFAANVAGGATVPDPNTYIELVPVTTVAHAIDGSTGDTGWVDLTPYLLAGFTSSSFKGRRVGAVITLRGAVTGSYPLGTTVTNFAADIPEAFVPSTNSWGAGYEGGESVSALIRPDATMAVSNRMAVVGTSLQFTITYLSD